MDLFITASGLETPELVTPILLAVEFDLGKEAFVFTGTVLVGILCTCGAKCWPGRRAVIPCWTKETGCGFELALRIFEAEKS